MPPEKIEESDEEEELPKSVRITTNVEYIDSKIIGNLKGVFGNSRSAVISYIVKDWIKANTNLLISYGIDIAGIRREIRSSIKGIEIEEDIQKRLFTELNKRFKRIKKYEIDKLAQLLSVHTQTLIDFITIKGDELEKAGLSLFIDGEYIVKENE
jgi:hypothetical protein